MKIVTVDLPNMPRQELVLDRIIDDRPSTPLALASPSRAQVLSELEVIMDLPEGQLLNNREIISKVYGNGNITVYVTPVFG